jgi:hypothetical protein
VISRPTTDQILLDCRRELLEVIGPEVTSEAGKVSVSMLENVLRNTAMRAAHEIAWMRSETAGMETYATDVAAELADSGPISSALAALAQGPRDSFHLDDVTTVYSLAGEALSCALEASVAQGNAALTERGAAILSARSTTELEIMGEWGFVGRG